MTTPRLLLALALALAATPGGCGERVDDRRLGEACTQDEDCEGSLVCVSGVCALPSDAGGGG